MKRLTPLDKALGVKVKFKNQKQHRGIKSEPIITYDSWGNATLQIGEKVWTGLSDQGIKVILRRQKK